MSDDLPTSQDPDIALLFTVLRVVVAIVALALGAFGCMVGYFVWDELISGWWSFLALTFVLSSICLAWAAIRGSRAIVIWIISEVIVQILASCF